ncbi:MAG: 4-alpha-glucanotransferase, partial [bacterium]
MEFPGLQGYMTGVAVPVTALRGDNDLGVGEFADLPRFGRFCRDSGLQVLQILPINDSGHDSSPYSALSAYALHPIYIRISDLPELADPKIADSVAPAIEAMRLKAQDRPKVVYREVLDAKFAVLRSIYEAVSGQLETDSALMRWIEDNPWVKPYAVFRMHKERNAQAAWWQWSELQDPTADDINDIWTAEQHRTELLFYAWIQMRLEQQLSLAVERLESMGVFLKGDIPILMNDDSTDVWLHRNAFRRDLRAGQHQQHCHGQRQ